jgi:hypothetical protein
MAEPVFETPTIEAPVIPAAEAPAPAAPEADLLDQLDVLLPEPFGPEPPTATAQAADVGSPVVPEPETAAGAPGGGEFDLVAPAEVVAAAAPVAAVPPQPAPPTRPIPAALPAARAHHRHEPSAPPPPEWGVLAAAIAISESPLDGPTPAPVATGAGVAGARPARRFSRLKWFTVVAVLLAGGAAAAVAVFGPANLLKFLH